MRGKSNGSKTAGGPNVRNDVTHGTIGYAVMVSIQVGERFDRKRTANAKVLSGDGLRRKMGGSGRQQRQVEGMFGNDSWR